jgi:hypothetical protein
VKDGQTCELVSEGVIPFVFLIVAFASILGIGAAKACKIQIHFKNTVIAITSCICKAEWILLLVLSIKDQHSQSTVILIFVLAASYILNLIFFILFLKVMRKD